MDRGTGFLLVLSMIICQFLAAGASVFYIFAVSDGMEISILVLYRLIFGTISITPFAFFYERKIRPNLTWTIILQAFMSGLLGQALAGNLYAESLRSTSATYAAAMSNLIPSITLIMSVIFGLESLDIRRYTGKGKGLGIALSIAGAMILIFYKGKNIDFSTNVNLLRHYESDTHLPVHHNLVWGTLLALFSCFCSAAWLILQNKLSQNYPPFSSAALMCFNGSIIAGVYCLCTERRHWSDWKLGWDIRLASAAYTGTVGSGIVIAITAWITRVGGPLFVSSFSPLAPMVVTLLGSLVLDEKLRSGSIIGSAIIAFGLCLVLWGKSKEMNDTTLEITSLADIPQLGDSRSREESPSSRVEQV